MTVLSMQGVDVTFGGLKALQDVALTVGTDIGILGLIGPNGAGKSTCINVLTGFQPPTGGRVLLDGRDMTGWTAAAFRRQGISRTFQAGRLFGALTVRENVAAACVGLGRSRPAADREADEILGWMGLDRLADLSAAALPYTDQRRTAIARALAGRPRVLLLDEPAAGMSEAEGVDLCTLIRRIRAELGTAILFVEHNISLVLAICDAITVLDSGTVIAHGDPAAIRTSQAVRDAYLGTALDAPDDRRHAVPDAAEVGA